MQEPMAWNSQPPRRAPEPPDDGGGLRTWVLVTGIIHIVLSIVTFDVLGCIAGGFQVAGAQAVCSGGRKVEYQIVVDQSGFFCDQ